ncbi:MAG: ATP-dependent metallopeptidase FtsH/Yme1/Tma family protein, partial [Clostridia bacterium]|nr:ATP-dependent metallopeptidase FtsH/Yme1/Tma family protein [Clostridia bacterium]
RHTLTEFENAYGVQTELDEGLLAAAVLYREGGKADARSLKGAAGNFVRKELLTLFSLCQTDGDGKKTDNVKNIRFSLDIDGADEAAKALFRESATVNGLLFCSEDRAAEIQKQAVVGVNLTFTDNLEDLKKLLRGDISFLLVDVTTHQNEDETVPADLEDLTSDGINAFHFAAEYYEELPIYILAPDDIHSDANTYTSFISAGAKDIVEFKRDDDKVFIRQMESLRRSAMIANGAYRLARSNNVLTFNSAQYFSEDGSEAEIVLRRLRVVRSVDAEDNQTIVSSVGLPGVTFDDIIGSKEAKNSLKEFAEYLKNPRAYLVKGVRAPRGVLLYGAPGTGKTMLAKALAGESGIAFIQKNGTEFFKKYVGEGPQAIRDLFRTARRYAPAVIFVDEVDSFAKMRTGGESERPAEALLNTFLSEMDGFVYDEKRPVFVLVATNFGIDPGSGNKVLDPAFVRRFDRKIKIELPDTEEREAFIRYYLSKHGVGGISDGAIHSLAVRSYGRSPADLEMVVEYALRLAGTEPLTDAVLSKSLDADRFGEEHIWKPETVLQTTYHEAGHTVISWLCGQKPSYVTNISRGGYGGYMLPEIDDTSFGKTKQQLLDDICCSLGGRAAEYVIYGEEKGNSTGASSDLQHATQIAKEILTAYCMDDNLVVMNDLPTYGELGKTFYEKINETVKTQFARAIGLLTENREALEALTKTIMEKNSLTQEEILTVLSPFKH